MYTETFLQASPQAAGDHVPILNWDECPAVSRSADVLAGTPVFKHSRVPVYSLFENLRGGTTIEEFIDWFPGITKEQVDAVLQFTTQNLKQIRAHPLRPQYA